MILDSFKTQSAIIQIHYADAFLLWDRAGEIARHISNIWPGIKFSEALPQQQTLTGEGVSIQTSFSKSTITVSGEHALNQLRVKQICDTYDVWRKELELNELSRVSTRVTYSKNFDSLGKANAELLALNLVQWPDTKVFEQPLESERNGLEIQYRFEDDNSFSLLKLKAEQLKYEVNLDPNVFDEPMIRKLINRTIIDFDRGLLSTVNASKFRMDEWIKGYQHILRRDIEKVLKSQP